MYICNEMQCYMWWDVHLPQCLCAELWLCRSKSACQARWGPQSEVMLRTSAWASFACPLPKAAHAWAWCKQLHLPGITVSHSNPLIMCGSHVVDIKIAAKWTNAMLGPIFEIGYKAEGSWMKPLYTHDVLHLKIMDWCVERIALGLNVHNAPSNLNAIASNY